MASTLCMESATIPATLPVTMGVEGSRWGVFLTNRSQSGDTDCQSKRGGPGATWQSDWSNISPVDQPVFQPDPGVRVCVKLARAMQSIFDGPAVSKRFNRSSGGPKGKDGRALAVVSRSGKRPASLSVSPYLNVDFA